MNIFSLAAQCCDAEEYLSLGELCANSGVCYHPLRPMGAIYWFSLPYRMGNDPSVLLLFHALLTITSILLSVIAARSLVRVINRPVSGMAETTVMALLSIATHMVFLLPTFDTTLTDTPASLLFLIAFWLIIIGIGYQNVLLMMFAGLCLGLSTWLRVFFYYPAILIAMMSCFFYINAGHRKGLYSAMLVCLLPIAFQIWVTAKHTSHYSFLDPSRSAPMMAAHLGNPVTGYDTIEQGHPVSWTSGCGEIEPLARSITNHDYYSLVCLLSGRLNFYLGSFGTSTYHIMTDDHLKKVKIPDFYSNNETQTIDPTTWNNIHATIYLEKSRKYNVYTEIWNENPDQHLLEFLVSPHGSEENISRNIILLSSKPDPEPIVISVPSSGEYDFIIRTFMPGPETEIDSAIMHEGISVNNKPFYIRNMTVYEDTRPPVRYWSRTLLAINMIALSGAIILLWRILKQQMQIGLYIVVLLFTSCGMALVIVPEQRFVIAPMIVIWIFFFIWIRTILPAFRSADTAHNDEP